MVEFASEKKNAEIEADLLQELLVMRKLAYSIMVFFPERYKGKLKETDFVTLPFDKVEEPPSREEVMARIKNKFKV